MSDRPSERPDFLLVSPGTTAGWRRADRELAEALAGLGGSVAICSTDFRIARHLRRGVLMTDLVEAGAMRRALSKALRRTRPKAIVYSSAQAAMLQPRGRLEGATAVRFDVPAAFNRSGPGSAILHALERRALRAVRMLLPIGSAPGEEALALQETVGKPMTALPISIELSDDGERGREREPLALAYAGNPEKKGLDIAVSAWASAAPSGWRLVVTGVDAAAGRRFLRRRGVSEPEGVEWAGLVERERYRELVGRAALFVAASRYEDYGLAQLEALAAGALLVTVPSAGSYEALRLARELGPSLVAGDVSPDALARSLRAALALEPAERAAYAGRARELLRPYSREALERRLAETVIPALLG